MFNFSDNISDIKAQIAANYHGSLLVQELIAEYGLEKVQINMIRIRENAEMAVRNLLKRTAEKYPEELSAVDYMDDGSPIKLRVKINKEEGSALFDFTGTGPQVYGNWNAPISVPL